MDPDSPISHASHTLKTACSWLAAISIAALLLLGAEANHASDRGVPLVDYHVHLKGGLTLEQAKTWAEEHGLQYGIAQNCGRGFPVTDDAGIYDYVADMRGQGVYVAMQAEGREWVETFSAAAIAEFDYVFSDSMTWRDDQGRRMRLWIPEEVFVDDEQHFMDMLVERTVWILEKEPIDIYVNPTFLPAVIADRYEPLWTNERMDLVIRAAVENDVAIEINDRYEIPSPTFLRRAKAAGATFALGTNNKFATDLGRLEYGRSMIAELKLGPEHMFVPRPDGQKAIQRKPLPRQVY